MTKPAETTPAIKHIHLSKLSQSDSNVRTVNADNKAWKPTKDNFFNRLSRPVLEATAEEIFGFEWMYQRSKLKKGDFAQDAEEDYRDEHKFLPSILKVEEISS